jgi:hypothetical protein
MITSTRFTRFAPSVAALLTGGVLTAATVSAQSRAPKRADQLEVEPIKCWWKSNTTGVIVGERFHVTLTCAVIETNAAKTVVNRDALDPKALTLTPFEVVSGTRHDDILQPPWRYFQYDYVVRLVGEEFFDKDIDLPPIDVAYNIVSTASETEAREHTYRLSPLPMRAVSIAPKKAADIRDAAQATFADIEARRFRSTTELIVAAVAAGFALLFVAIALARALGKLRGRQRVTVRPLPAAAALRGSIRDLRALNREVAGDGWNQARIVRALASLRVAAAAASGHAIAHAIVDRRTPAREGQVALRSGILHRRSFVVSAGSRASLNGSGDIGDALRVFTLARYGRAGELDAAALDASLAAALSAMRRLSLRAWWPGGIPSGPPPARLGVRA